MAEEPRPPEPEASMVAALDDAAATLLSVWEEARERTTDRLSVAQLRAVMVVEQHDGINLRRLATLLKTLLPSASRLCDRLVAAGMLEREPGRYDRREIALHLTPEAARFLAELRAARQARLAEVLAGMSPAGREALRHGLAEFRAAARRSPPADRAHAAPDELQAPADQVHAPADEHQTPADRAPAPADEHQAPAGPHLAPVDPHQAPAGPYRVYEPSAQATPGDPGAGAGQRAPVSAPRGPASGPGPARPLVAAPPPAPPTARPA
ncbi:DNA-binding transcriptional regulator, MarR family [Micromonospora pallida]|uniref:DNA-binding transcriptional regulator, MarR family n=1 Tax=Micromonospora pallida TaxID=145854 RepID=A0A1C6TII5_9ACTN|nr:MarR family transcriptional regulator [Micromonospora pallida]SCL41570.1 DNA-binding transcriptional regulator, MarR family [Micromonospora pallida]